jgi:RimJ/RimL family protein N-acetyltransferase
MHDNLQFTFTKLTENDLPLLLKWFKEPHVAQWWPIPEDQESFFTQFLEKIRSTNTFPYLVLMNNKPIGYIQYYYIDPLSLQNAWLPSLPENTIGTDQFIGEVHYTNKGYGCRFIKEFIIYVVTHEIREIPAVIVDPHPHNKAAIRCYEKGGFVAIGTYETPEGPALLMRYDIVSD